MYKKESVNTFSLKLLRYMYTVEKNVVFLPHCVVHQPQLDRKINANCRKPKIKFFFV